MKLASTLFIALVTVIGMQSAHAVNAGDCAYGETYTGPGQPYVYKKYKVLAIGLDDGGESGVSFGSFSLVQRTGVAGLISGPKLMLTCRLTKIGQNDSSKAAKDVELASLGAEAKGEKVYSESRHVQKDASTAALVNGAQ